MSRSRFKYRIVIELFEFSCDGFDIWEDGTGFLHMIATNCLQQIAAGTKQINCFLEHESIQNIGLRTLCTLIYQPLHEKNA